MLFQAPLFPALIAVVHLFVSDWSLAARLVSATSLALIHIPLFLITRELFSKKAAFWACLAFAVAPMPNEWSIMVIRGPLFLLLLSCAVMFALRSMHSKKIVYFAATLLFTVASMLCRLEGVVFVGFYMICLVFWAIRYPSFRSHYVKGLVIWVAFFTFLFVIIALAGDTTDVTAVNRFGYLYTLLQSVLQMTFLDKYHQIAAFLKTMEGTGPFSGFGKGFLETSRHYLFLVYIISILETTIRVLWPLFCIPLFWARRCPKDLYFWFICGVMGIFCVTSYLFLIMNDYFASRYIWTSVFFLYPMVGFGLTKIIDRLETVKRSKIWLAVVLIAFFIPPTVKSIAPLTDNHTSIIEAGRWLGSQNLPESTSIATTENRVLYYAGLDIYKDFDKTKGVGKRFYPLQIVDTDELVRKQKADVLIIKRSRKRLWDTIDLKLYHKVKTFEDKKYVINIYQSNRFIQRLPE